MPTLRAHLSRTVGSIASLLCCVLPALADTAPPRIDVPPAAATATPAPASSPDQSSYNLGLVMGAQLEHAGLSATVVPGELIRGLKDALAAKAPTAQQRDDAVRFMRAARDVLAERNRAVAREFLARNAQVAGVTTTASGLQYHIFAPGDSKANVPGPNDQVTVHYRATLADGTEFDNSYARGQPATFKMNGVIKGWHEAFMLMKPGAKWQLWVPPALGYDTMSPPPIPPGSLVIYELELLKVEPPGQVTPEMRRSPPAKPAPKPAAKNAPAPAK